MVFKLEGNWRAGIAFDVHTISSTHVGFNEYGRDVFDTKRSEMGELVYKLKYRSDKSCIAKIVELLDAVTGIETFDVLVPIPPTNKSRPIKLVEEITIALGKRRGVEVMPELLLNMGNEELKTVTDPVARNEMLQKAIKLSAGQNVQGKKLLLVDDLYRSGSTLAVATDLLYKEGKASSVCVLTMTKTKSNR